MSQERSDSIKVLNIFCSSSIQEVSIYFTYTFWNNYSNNYPMQYFIRANKFDLSNQRMTLIKWVFIVSAKITTQRLKNPSVSSCIILKYVKWCNDTQDCKVKHYLIHSTLLLICAIFSRLVLKIFWSYIQCLWIKCPCCVIKNQCLYENYFKPRLLIFCETLKYWNVEHRIWESYIKN